MAAKKKTPASKASPNVQVDPDRKRRAQEVAERLAVAIERPVVELDFENPWQLIIATILSAQSTDKLINKVTPALFERFPTPAALAAADPAEVEDLVHATGFFRNKAKAIQKTSQVLVDEFGGEVPKTIKELIRLPGVARKTANVVLGDAFGIAEGVVVDVHVTRVVARLGLTEESDSARIERALMDLYPKEEWIEGGMRLVLLGRYVCLSREPRCDACPLAEICPAQERMPEGSWQERASRVGAVVESRGDTKL